MSDESWKDKIILKFAQKLASNESKVRNRSVKKLRNFLSLKSKADDAFSEKELLKLWKGLHYCMWMCDKPLVQQELSESLSKLVHAFGKVEVALNFFSAFLKTQAREWFTTDRLRLDKFMMLIRMSFREMFILLQQHEWKSNHIKLLNSILVSDILPKQSDHVPDGLKYHVISLYLEELAKVGAKELAADLLLEILQPFMDVLLVTNRPALQSYLVKNVFEGILRRARKQIIHEREKADASEEEMETEENEKDRHTHLQFDCEALGSRLFELASKKSCPAKNRASVYALVKKFQQVGEVEVAGGVEVEPDYNGVPRREENRALSELVRMEDNIVQRERSRKSDKKRRKKQKQAKGSDSEQEEPATKKQKMETPSTKKTKNKFKDTESCAVKQGKEVKAGRGMEELSDEETVQESSQCSSEDALFQAALWSDEDEEEEGSEGETVEEVSSPSDEAVQSKMKSSLTKKKSQKKTKKSDRTLEEMEAIFVGGFMSDEEEVDTNHKTIEKKKKKKSSSLKSQKDWLEVDSNGSIELDEDELDISQESDQLEDLITENVSSGKKKKKRKNSAGELDLEGITGKKGDKGKSLLNGSVSSDSPAMKSGKKAKSKSKKQEGKKGSKAQADSDDNLVDESMKACGSDDEVEIYIPNKKYQGKYKDWSLQQEATSISGATPSPTSSKQSKSAEKKKKKGANKVSTPVSEKQFASFDELMHTPPAFVKKSVLKSTTPKTDPRHNRKSKADQENEIGGEGKRRVSFGLHKNVAQSTKDEARSSTIFLSDEEYEKTDDIELWTDSVLSSQKSKKLSHKPLVKSSDEQNEILLTSDDEYSVPSCSKTDWFSSAGDTKKKMYGKSQSKDCGAPNGQNLDMKIYYKIDMDTQSEEEEDCVELIASTRTNKQDDRGIIKHARISKKQKPSTVGDCEEQAVVLKDDTEESRRSSSDSRSPGAEVVCEDSGKKKSKKSALRSSSSVVIIGERKSLDISSQAKSSCKNKGVKQLTEPCSDDSKVLAKKKPLLKSSSSVIVVEETDDSVDSETKPLHDKRISNFSSDVLICDSHSSPGASRRNSNKSISLKAECSDSEEICDLKSKGRTSVTKSEKAKGKKETISKGEGYTNDFLCEDENIFLFSKKPVKKRLLKEDFDGAQVGVTETDKTNSKVLQKPDKLKNKNIELNDPFEVSSTEDDGGSETRSRSSRGSSSKSTENRRSSSTSKGTNVKESMKLASPLPETSGPCCTIETVKPNKSPLPKSPRKLSVKPVTTDGQNLRKSSLLNVRKTDTPTKCSSPQTSADEHQDKKFVRRSKRILGKKFSDSEESDNDDCVILDVSSGSSPQVKYVRTHKLTAADYEVIRNNDWLTDIHINLAHALLKKKFPSWQGLENCCLGSKKQQAFTPVSGRFVQIYNAHGNHWITITNAYCSEKGNSKNQVTVYDSYYRTIHSDTKKVILNLLDDYIDKASCKVIHVKMTEFQKQRAQSDCGLFAIASATSLLHGEDPSDQVYKQSAMRPHLESCFHKQHLTPFPTVTAGTKTKLQEKICPIKLSHSKSVSR